MKRTVMLAVFIIAVASLAVRSQQVKTPGANDESVMSASNETQVVPAKSGVHAPVFEKYVHQANFSLRYEKLRQAAPSSEHLDKAPTNEHRVTDHLIEPESDFTRPAAPANFNWSGAIRQSLLFLAIQHGYAIGGQSKTRESLKGPFFQDYFRSVRSLSGWADGGRFVTNYIAHPMQGSFMGFIQVQNDPAGKRLRINNSGAYWKSRAKALAWSAAWSTQFEIGPLSQASIGNVGLKGKQTYVDIVITPTVGILMLVVEDALDQFVIRRIEDWTKNPYVRIFARMLLNPTRTMANIIRFEYPWYRDPGLR